MKIAYFVGGGLGAIAFSNFLKLFVRIFPPFQLSGLIILAVVLVIGLGVAMWFADDTEESLTGWFIGACGLFMGVMLGAI